MQILYTFNCKVVGVACGNLSVSVIARDFISALNKIHKLFDVASHDLVKVEKINMASPAQAEKYKKFLS